MHTKKIARALLIIFALNLTVTVVRFVLATTTDSASITADAWHALSDSAANIVALFGLWKAAKPPDKEHPWGHQKFETLALLGIGALIALAGLQVLEQVVHRLSGGSSSPKFSDTAFWWLLATVGINAVVARAERILGKRWNSALLAADAKHTATDLLAAIAVLVGFGAIRFGITFLDPCAGLFIVGLILWLAWPLVRDNSRVLVDAAVYDEKEICATAEGIAGVVGCHDVKSRKGFIQIHVELDPSITLEQAHAVCHEIEVVLAEKFNAAVTIQIEPHGPEITSPQA